MAFVPSQVEARLTAPGPKRLLSVDGGGIRVLIAVEFLSRLETLLRQATGRDNLVLADFFDYVAGTSAGSERIGRDSRKSGRRPSGL